MKEKPQAALQEDDGAQAGTQDSTSKTSRKRPWIIAAFVFLSHVMGALSSIHAVMDVRTSQGAIAWAVSLNTFPYVAVPAYWVFGRTRFQGYITARHGKMAEIAEVTDRAKVAVRPFLPLSEDFGSAARAAEVLADIPFIKGNSVELLIDGEETFSSIIEGIESAQEYILFQFYIVRDDRLGRKIQSHLIRKAEAGVRVKFLYDEIGCHALPHRFKDELREAGALVSAFNTRKGPRNRFQLNFRNHRKVVVVDGQTAWIGGHNVGDEYLGRDPRKGNWRDTHVRIEGPAALFAQVSFAEDWYWATDTLLQLDWRPDAAPGGGLPVLIVPSGPADRFETANLLFVNAINSARERIWITSPYFVPDSAVMAALQLAGLRGVDVRILIPDQPDIYAVHLAAYSYFDEAKRAGVTFHRYLDGFLHAKTMLIDSEVSVVGTANFDNRSFRLNFDISAVVLDEDFAGQMERMFEADFAKSRQMAPGEADRKPLWFRVGVRLSRLAAPLL